MEEPLAEIKGKNAPCPLAAIWSEYTFLTRKRHSGRAGEPLSTSGSAYLLNAEVALRGRTQQAAPPEARKWTHSSNMSSI